MSEPGKPHRASQPEADECLDFCPGGKAEESIERADASSGQIAGRCTASPPLQEDEVVLIPRRDIYLSDQDRDLFLALLNSDEGPNEALRQAAERFKRTG